MEFRLGVVGFEFELAGSVAGAGHAVGLDLGGYDSVRGGFPAVLFEEREIFVPGLDVDVVFE